MTREGGEEILVDRIALAVDALLFVHFGGEAPALFVRIGQLAKPVGELDAAGIELETLGNARIARHAARERGLGRRVVVEDGRRGRARGWARPFRRGSG